MQKLQVPRRTVARRAEAISADLKHQPVRDVNNCLSFGLCLDESTDLCDILQVAVMVHMLFSIFYSERKFLEHAKGKTGSEGVFLTFKNYATEINLLLQNLTSITMDGTPTMVGSINGVIAHCKKFVSKFVS